MKILLFPLCVVVGIGVMFYWLGNPNSSHNINYRKFQEDCEASGGVVAHYRTSALPHTDTSCIRRDSTIDLGKMVGSVEGRP